MYRTLLLSSEKSSTNQSWCLLAWSSFTAPQTQRSMTFLEKYLSFGSRTWNRKRSLQVPLPDAKGAIRMKGSERLENGRCKVKASPKSKSFLTPRFRWIRSFLFGWAISSTRITSTLWSLEGEDSNDLKSLIVISNILCLCIWKLTFLKGCGRIDKAAGGFQSGQYAGYLSHSLGASCLVLADVSLLKWFTTCNHDSIPQTQDSAANWRLKKAVRVIDCGQL